MKAIFQKSKHPGYVAEVVLKESYDELQKRIDEAIELIEQELKNKDIDIGLKAILEILLSILRGEDNE